MHKAKNLTATYAYGPIRLAYGYLRERSRLGPYRSEHPVAMGLDERCLVPVRHSASDGRISEFAVRTIQTG
jgi:hypothetical protein